MAVASITKASIAEASVSAETAASKAHNSAPPYALLLHRIHHACNWYRHIWKSIPQISETASKTGFPFSKTTCSYNLSFLGCLLKIGYLTSRFPVFFYRS